MSYIKKVNNQIQVSAKFKNDYDNAQVENKDGVLMDLLGELGFDCGKTRWDSPILYTHMQSRKIVIAIKCPTAFDGWNGCPYPTTPGRNFTFFHEQEYQVRILSDFGGFIGRQIIYQKDFPSNMLGARHWFNLPNNIRETWDSSL